MMRRTLIVLVGIVASVVAVALIAAQRRELASLHQQQLQQQATEIPLPTPRLAASVATAPSQQHSPSLELLRLRGEVGQLERRKRELAGIGTENERLRAQIATKGTNATGGIALPPGYVRKAQARFVGCNTPEDTVQSLLWAIQNRETASFLQMFDPEEAKRMEARIQNRGSAEEFFKEADSLPGMRIIRKEMVANDTVDLTVEILPGHDSKFPELRLKQIDGKWKLISGL